MTKIWRMMLGLVTGCALVAGAGGQKTKGPAVLAPGATQHAVLWRDPGSVAEKDLFHGPGGKEGMPEPPFTFEQEIAGKGTPRFLAHDGPGKQWMVGVGQDARPEVAASRLLWAVGYLADEDYVLWKANVNGLKLKSGKKYLKKGAISDARFARKVDGQTQIGIWSWRRNAFTGTRELNGLRVMMAILNCWDLRDENNPVVRDTRSGSEQFRLSGLGGSFGKAGPGLFRRRAKQDVKGFARSGFITKRTDAYVDFATPSRSYNPFALFSRKSGSTRIGRGIPRKDVKWIAAMLGQLSHKQIEDAFWAAGYPVNEVNTFANVVDGRIRALVDM